jgi:4'-phosphopantetheinyl transferase
MWDDLPKQFELKEEEVHVFCWQLADVKKEHSEFYGFLSSDEMARAQRFKFDIHRQRFTINHMFLRVILSRYLDRKPEDLQFIYNTYGKPFLENSSIFFNLSHSEDCGVLAVSREKMLGIDIEYVKSREDFSELAKRFFAPQEVEQLEVSPAAEKLLAFYRLWTLKEAFIKALGQGLSLPLESFAIDFKAPKLLFTAKEADLSPWSFSQLPEIQGYVGAMAVALAQPKYQFFNAAILENG